MERHRPCHGDVDHPCRAHEGRETAPSAAVARRRGGRGGGQETWPRAATFVFSLDGEKPISTAAMSAVLKRLAAKGELPSDVDGRPAVVHGFRSTFRDWAAESEYPDPVAEAALAHAEKDGTVAAYKRTDYFEQRRVMMNEWAHFCCCKVCSEGRGGSRSKGTCAVGGCPLTSRSAMGLRPLGGPEDSKSWSGMPSPTT